MPPLDISLCMIVRNEEHHLADCLESVRDLVSEVLIGDTGSTDGTRSIALSWGARIIPLKWDHDFAEARNQVLEQAAYSWILVLDADEQADGWEAEALGELLRRDEQTAGFYIPFINYFGDGSKEEYYTDAVCRLFRNHPHIRFQGAIHENVADSILKMTGRPIPHAPFHIKHFGYLDSEIRQKNKHARNMELIGSSIEKEPLNPQLRYALGTEYFQEGEFAAALQQLLTVIEMNPASGYMSDVYLKTVYSLQMTGQNELANRLTDQGLKDYPDFADLMVIKSSQLFSHGNAEEAYSWMLRAATTGGVQYKYSTTAGSGTYRTHWLAGRLSEKMLNPDQALMHYQHAMQYNPDFFPAWTDAFHLSLLRSSSELVIAWNRSRMSTLTPEQQNHWITAALNMGDTAMLEYIRSMPAIGKQRLDWVQMMQKLASAAGDRLYDECFRFCQSEPGNPFYLSYLWAAAWKSEDTAGADRIAGQLVNSASLLPAVHAYMTGREPCLPNLKNVHAALQLFLQCRAFDHVLRLLSDMCSHSSISTLPPTAVAGILSAPPDVVRDWCDKWEASFSDLRPSSRSLQELLLYASLGKRCSSVKCLNVAARELERSSDAPYAAAARAACLTELAKHLHSVPLRQHLDLPLLYRASALHF